MLKESLGAGLLQHFSGCISHANRLSDDCSGFHCGFNGPVQPGVRTSYRRIPRKVSSCLCLHWLGVKPLQRRNARVKELASL